MRKRVAIRARRSRERRRGSFALELVFTLPILGLMLFALFEFSMLFFARATVLEASRNGARQASLPSVSREDVVATVRRVLPPRLREDAQVYVNAGRETGDVVAVIVAVPMSNASPDLLWPVGFSLRGRNLVAETRMIKE